MTNTENSIKLKKLIRFILLLLAAFFALNLHGETSPDIYKPDISNPFHDVFYSYYSSNKKQAIKMLKKLFNNNKYKNHALINYGLINEYETNFPEAEKYYKEALNNNEKVAFIYLYILYKKYNKEKLLPLIQKIQNDNWTLYEKSVHYAEINDENNAIECLSQAIENGFSSPNLLLNDPAFNNLKKTFKFKWLLHKAEKNHSKSISIVQKMKKAELEYKKDKPYGMISELDVAAYYEKTGKEKKALNILTSLVNSKISFRDKSVALFWLARINAKNNEKKIAKQYLQNFIEHVSGQEKDSTGYKNIIAPLYKDIVLNDEYLKKIADEKN